MSRRTRSHQPFNPSSELPSDLKKNYSITIFILVVLSVLKISLNSDNGAWSFSLELNVTSITLLLLFLLWLPTLLPWFLERIPQMRGSLNWLREQGIEEIETNLLKIKLRYGVQEASETYQTQISEVGAINLTSQETQQQLEQRYQEAIALVDAASNIESAEALKRIDQLAGYYDRVREEMSPGSNRTRLMLQISSTMWALVPKVTHFPITERLNSAKGGERLSAYKYIEWTAFIDEIDLLVSRAIGVLEVPFNQYSALLALRRVVTNHSFSPEQSKAIVDVLTWSSDLDYISSDRQQLMIEIASILKAKL
ncbi:hypothetical protein H6G89_15770 [Oscillatoria sp. FACHB-1407]|uniref:hypothetical protein n=1 Tax=Oscillatoria sp. FACHB-1407 TaxID=2692847 RepID=UPI001682D161|nr:hypothetical protein [Oscillatoria sp. FACHB-1407]MBD2462504.1 hypothetical protein [Oscillatoria sp. FACHB-1407]